MLGRLRGLEGLALDCLGFFFRQQSAGKIVGSGSRRGDRRRCRRRGRRVREISRRRFGATCEESQGSAEKKKTPAKVIHHGITHTEIGVSSKLAASIPIFGSCFLFPAGNQP